MEKREGGAWAALPGIAPKEDAKPAAQHRTNIRGFLSMIDPETGYIEED